MRPRVKRALRRLDRGPDTIQFGVHPARAVLLTEVAPAVRKLIDALDGTRTLDELLAGAARFGLDAAAVRQVLDLLVGQGVVEDAGRRPVAGLGPGERDRLGPDLDALSLAPGTLDGGAAVLERRRLAQVRVYGAGRVGAQVAALLAAAGVGHLCVIDPGPVRPWHLAPGGLTSAELGGPRDEGAVAAARRAAPEVNAWTGRTASQLGDRRPGPDLVVLAPVTPLDGVLARELVVQGIPHLAAAVVEGCGVVGPLVLPGRTACLHCMDLTRRDRDPGWPAVGAGLGGLPLEESACDAVTATAVAAQTAEYALAFLDGRDGVPAGRTVELVPGRRPRRKAWVRHPQCRCFRNHPFSLRMVA